MARRLIGRATPDDLAHLDAVGRREARWGAAYLALYVPGVIWGTWYYVKFALPAIWLILRMSADAVVQHGLLSPLGLAGAVSALLCAVPNVLMMYGAMRSAARVLRTTIIGAQTSPDQKAGS